MSVGEVSRLLLITMCLPAAGAFQKSRAPDTAFFLFGPDGLLVGPLGVATCGGPRQALIVVCFSLQVPVGTARADGGAASPVDDSGGRGSQEDSEAVLQRGTGVAGAAAVAAGADKAGQDQKTPAKQGD